MKTWIPIFVLALLIMVWASWLFRYEYSLQKGQVILFDRWTGLISVSGFGQRDKKDYITTLKVKPDGTAKTKESEISK